LHRLFITGSNSCPSRYRSLSLITIFRYLVQMYTKRIKIAVRRSIEVFMRDELTTFNTSVGWCAMLGRGDILRALVFGHASSDAALAHVEKKLATDARRSRWNRALVRRITVMLEGEPDNFSDVQIDFEHFTSFGRQVIRNCRRIAWGQTRSYAELAASAGSPGAARAVGQLMATNRTPLVVPCHRVIASGGRIGGFSAPQGLAMKRRLIALESALARLPR
jgi:methylated-DNA-[protein]-cysteine S-methyltransferase